MSIIRKLKIKKQRLSGLFLQPSIPKIPETVQGLISPEQNIIENTNKSPIKDKFGNVILENKIVDGYWIVLQEWTQCSLKCGGGTSTLHRMCVPPKYGGKDCEGSNIISKPCNIQPCPEIKILKNSLKNNETMKDPIVKVVTFSNRPQRYTVYYFFSYLIL